MFKQGGAVKNLNVIASLYNKPIQLIVAKDSAFKQLQILKGKK